MMDNWSPKAKKRFLICFFSLVLFLMIFGWDIEKWLAGLKGRSP
jgi:hypothetical protein